MVKAFPIHKKNPSQHFSDLLMLSVSNELQPVFQNVATGVSKEIDCVRVDGAADEGPSHHQVQYWWTEWHVRQGKLATLLTTRSSGSSYLNRVELQNGCLSLGHSNTFIPSTLAGSCVDGDSGKRDDRKLRENLSLAITAYISRVSGCPCGDTTIQLFEGSTIEEHHITSEKLDIFLKGSNRQRLGLQKECPSVYSRFKMIWDIRSRHMVKDLPPTYIFFLKCCFQQGCPHPLCSSGLPSTDLCWYASGPPLSKFPLPIKDPARPWGGQNCTSCTGFCAGHYCIPLVDITDPAVLQIVAKPPSVILKQKFAELEGDNITDDFVKSAAKSVLLSTEETKIWLDHLGTVLKNRKRGAAKAAETRLKKNSTIAGTQQVSQTAATIGTHQTEGRTTHTGGSVGSFTSLPTAAPPPNSSLTGEFSPGSNQTVLGTDNYCRSCGKDFYASSSSSSDFWIGCDMCDHWYCNGCEGLLTEPTSEMYVYKKCKE